MKFCPLFYLDYDIKATLIREVAHLKRLKHNNIITLRSIFYDDMETEDPYVVLELEYMDSNLRQYMEKNKNMTSEEIKCLTYQLLSGISYCHENDVMHRAIIPEHVLIHQGKHLKLCDFAWSSAYNNPVSTHYKAYNPSEYSPPEHLLSCRERGKSADIWSAGCIIIEMFTNQKPFKCKGQDFDSDDVLRHIFSFTEPTIENALRDGTRVPKCVITTKGIRRLLEGRDITENEVDLIERMLQPQPKDRILASKALIHSWFKTLNPLSMMPPKLLTLSTSRRFGQLRKLLYRYRAKKHYLNKIAMAIDNRTQFTGAQREWARKMLNTYGVSNGILLGAQIYLSRLRDVQPAGWDDIPPLFIFLSCLHFCSKFVNDKSTVDILFLKDDWLNESPMSNLTHEKVMEFIGTLALIFLDILEWDLTITAHDAHNISGHYRTKKTSSKLGNRDTRNQKNGS